MKNTKRTSIILKPGEVVKELRLKKGWSQQVLSEISGIAVTNLSNIERGKSRLGEDRAVVLAAALGVKPEFLIFPNGFERPDLKNKLAEVRTRKKKFEKKLAA